MVTAGATVAILGLMTNGIAQMGRLGRMRMIDADALVEKYGNYYTEEGTEEGFIGTLKSLIDEQPTIGGWISVEDRLPEETDSIFARHYGTDRWANAMWRSNSAKVIVAVTFDDGSRSVVAGSTHDGKWHTSISELLRPKVTHWMPMPELPEQDFVDKSKL